VSDLIPCVIEGEFAWQVCNSFDGGVNELEVGAACVNQEAADSLEAKINKALDNRKGVNIRLTLTVDECYVMAVSGQNCSYQHLPEPQRAWVQEWHEKWKNSHYCHGLPKFPVSYDPLKVHNPELTILKGGKEA